MASAQVISNPRKLGHLEAGKKKLEEFRKKKAEGRAKKAASTGQLVSADTDQYEKSSENSEHVRDGSTSGTYTSPSGLGMAPETKAAYSFESTDIGASNEIHATSSVLAESGHSLYDDSKRYAGKGASEKSESSGFSESVYYDHGRESGELSHKVETKIGSSDDSSADQFNAFNITNKSPNIYMDNNHSNFHSFLKDQSIQDRYSSKVNASNPETYGVTPVRTLEKSEKVIEQSTLGVPSSSANTSGLREGAAAGTGFYHSGNMYHDNAMYSGGRKMDDRLENHFDVDSARLRSSKSSYESSSLAYKSSQYQEPFSSAGYGTSSGRSRPSFLDSLGVSRVSSSSHVPDGEPKKAEPPAFRNSQIQSTDIPGFSLDRAVSEFKTADQSFKPSTPDYYTGNELSMNSASPNDAKQTSPNNAKQMSEKAGDYHAQRGHEFTVKKDEDFTALEQHIEDLTQEKFSLQRALDTSQTLAQSLAAENSSLTDSYNQQGKVVSQLRSDIERLEKEIKAQLLAFESLKMEFANAQLECNAADERAKILASEVIGLEEKALRLRSNELKLGKQLENMDSEMTSYKRKVSILEKERQDFQSTIDALQEEKKLLQSKLRKASTDGKVNDSKKTSAQRSVSTSTEDIGEMVTSTINPLQDRETSAVLATDASISPMLPEDGGLNVPDASADIPHDQLRMIDNINSLISELALEREELVGALKIESSNCLKLKDLNKDLSQKLEAQTQRLELLTAQRMAAGDALARPIDTHSMQDTVESVDEGDEVVERVLGWIMKLFPGGPAKRRPSKRL
ncbi:uncharacterized protein M6B38_284830 [Iris pallida]|uniref:BLISTER n=1 Tax=Iris pallida TaxID=29817 RepID=A0AAX6I1H0_IRIPA|nr:uncharacterized protein M6B38_284830 [Iris pallida]